MSGRLLCLSEFKLCHSNKNPQILLAYSNNCFILVRVDCYRWPLWLCPTHLLIPGHVLKEQPTAGMLCSLSKAKRTRGRDMPSTALEASQTWLLSQPFIVHWPKHVTRPSLQMSPRGHMSKRGDVESSYRGGSS